MKITDIMKKETLDLLVKKELHLDLLPKEGANIIYANFRKRHPHRVPSYLDTHYIMNSNGEVTYIGWSDGVHYHAYSYEESQKANKND